MQIPCGGIYVSEDVKISHPIPDKGDNNAAVQNKSVEVAGLAKRLSISNMIFIGSVCAV